MMGTCKEKGTGDRGQQVYFLLRSIKCSSQGRDSILCFVLRSIFFGVILGTVRYFSLQTGQDITIHWKHHVMSGPSDRSQLKFDKRPENSFPRPSRSPHHDVTKINTCTRNRPSGRTVHEPLHSLRYIRLWEARF